MSHDVSGAAQRLLSVSVDGYAAGHNRPGMCLRWSYFAYNLKPNLTPAGIAMDAWTNAPAEHRHAITENTVVPAGLPIILGPSPSRTDGNRNAGDVFPALGNGPGLMNLGNMTDSPRLGTGRIGPATLSERAIQTRRPVLGYLTHWLGYDLSSSALLAPAPSPAPDIEPEEEDMSYSLVPDAKSDAIYICSTVTGKRARVGNPTHVKLLQRYKKNNSDSDMLMAELDICASYIRAIAPTAAAATVDAAALAKLIKIPTQFTITGKAAA